MPYIPQNERPRYNAAIKNVVKLLFEKTFADNDKDFSEGDLNYFVSSVVWALFDAKPSYRTGNKLVGCLECVKQEFLRRRLNDYEDIKILQSGDIGIME